MRHVESGDRVRVDIPDTEDPDFDRYHGHRGEVVDVIKDDAGEHTGDERDSYLYEVELPGGETAHFRWRDLRPAVDESE
ncbi:hypothetical protein [Salinarchaeum laminariae]|uniref:hypothetical protein n=1 Tax=Salinarchaeum laminariae TaxID=869888 RepID=UPI0020BD6972|nr:hypothetical protein [Salinarchaeum laminariae]